MKRRNIIVCNLLIIIVVSIITIIINIENKKTFTKDGVTYALNVDGTPSTSFPAKGMYRVDVTCENGTGKWDYDNWKLYIENITGNVSCDMKFTTVSKEYFNNYIIGLSGTTQGSGEVVNENGYRYEGQNPNNYVWFNNELWRIIGVFDESSHGVSDTNLVKIIRANSIGGLIWDNDTTESIYGKNDWTTASLMNLLNGAYYNQQDGTDGDYCYAYSTTAKAHCDYTNIGISLSYRNMIKNVTWYLGGWSTHSVTTEAMYGYERGDTVYSGRPISTTGNIGLMYASDYGYAALASSCARTTNLSAYNTVACTLGNWLYGNGYEWTITPYSSDSYFVFNVHNGGRVYGGYYIARNCFAVRPVLYLDSSVYVIDGSGTETDPYIIGM